MTIDEVGVKYRSIQVVVDSTYFYLMDGSMPFIYRGKVNEWKADTKIPSDVYFTQCVPISVGNLAMLSMRDYKNIFVKRATSTGRAEYFPNLLETQIDGLFCTAGSLLSSKESARLVYVYTYRNAFFTIDTALNLQQRGRTIDPVDTAQIKVAQMKSGRSIKMAAPPLVVNKAVCVSRDHLYVHSNILAANEDANEFERCAVIDVYNLNHTHYMNSFYIPDYNGYKVRDFRVSRDKLFALHGPYLVAYELGLISY